MIAKKTDLDIKKIQPESSLVGDLGMDDIELAFLPDWVEEIFKAFQIEISDSIAKQWQTVGDVIKYSKTQLLLKIIFNQQGGQNV